MFALSLPIVFPSAMGHGMPTEFHLHQELIHRLQCPLDPPLVGARPAQEGKRLVTWCGHLLVIHSSCQPDLKIYFQTFQRSIVMGAVENC